jgi:hypothetical protein
LSSFPGTGIFFAGIFRFSRARQSFPAEILGFPGKEDLFRREKWPFTAVPGCRRRIYDWGLTIDGRFSGSFLSSPEFHYDEALGKFAPTWEYPTLHLAITKQGTNGLLRVMGPLGSSYTLQSKTDPSATNWHYFWSSKIDATGFDEFPILLSFPARFFRTVHP